jgi:superkiller protein 3
MAVATFEPFLTSQSQLNTSVLHQPAFALRHYTHRRPTDSAAAHLYALICERLGLVSEAVASLETAVELLEQEFEHSESTEIEHRYTIALLNLGRVRLADRGYEASLEAYTNSFELLSGSQHPDAGLLRIQARLGQALAQYWLGQVDESLGAFQQALDECNAQSDKETVAVLLARTLWGLGSDEAKELAKSHLMEWSVYPVSLRYGTHWLTHQ